MASETGSIVYMPRDRRRKIDHKHLEAKHFHNLLLVSKTFITVDDLAFALLSTAILTFYSLNELHRLVDEVKPAFKQCVQRMQLVRTWSDHPVGPLKENFASFSSIEKILSTNVAKLKKIYLALPEWCAPVGRHEGQHPPSREDISAILDLMSSSQDSTPAELLLSKPRTKAASHVAARFVGNRNTHRSGYAFIRPQAWIRRLVMFAEEANIEVVFDMALCIINRCSPGLSTSESYGESSHRQCWSESPRQYFCTLHWLVHINAQMSTKDWMLRVKHGSQEYSIRQDLAYQMIHAPPNKGNLWWQDLLRDLYQAQGTAYALPF